MHLASTDFALAKPTNSTRQPTPANPPRPATAARQLNIPSTPQKNILRKVRMQSIPCIQSTALASTPDGVATLGQEVTLGRQAGRPNCWPRYTRKEKQVKEAAPSSPSLGHQCHDGCVDSILLGGTCTPPPPPPCLHFQCARPQTMPSPKIRHDQEEKATKASRSQDVNPPPSK